MKTRRTIRQIRIPQHGHSLFELVIAMTSASVLMAGLGSAVLLTSRAFRPETTSQHFHTSAALVDRDVLSNLHLATGFTERTDKSAAFLVPDRDGDGRPELLRYAWSGRVGDPLMFTYNNSAAIPLLNDVRAFSLSYVTRDVPAVKLPAEQTGSQILLLLNDSTSPTADELSRKTLLESWNFVVLMVGLNDPNAVFDGIQTSKAVYVSGTVNASKFPAWGKIAGQSIGIVNESVELVDEFGFATAATTSFASQVTIVDNTHYITSGFATGNVSIVSVPTQLVALKSSPSKGLNNLAAVSDIPALVTIDPGDALQDGSPSAGRRAMLPWGGPDFDPLQLRPDGQTLTLRAIEWATGLGSTTINLKKFGYETAFGSSATKQKSVQLATRANLPENGIVKSISAYVGGAVGAVRFAIYSDANGEPGTLIVQSATGTSQSALGWITLTVPDTKLASGNYWLALSLGSASQSCRYTSTAIAGGGRRRRSWDAVNQGFIGTWGRSSLSSAGACSIYATYQPLN